ncbi:MAG: UvrD-helicase domain-containing protein [Elusimicrobia bacterium]|nr:UvrD-helicase domain-containing protein [Elusimicrobiota bacterium]
MTANVQKKPNAPASAAPSDKESRDLARLTLDRNVVVEAGAGTGKTTLLTDRLLFLLLGAGVPITGIVALTFTEKAAGEIRVRLGERLLDLLEHWKEGGELTEFRRTQCEQLARELKDRFHVGAKAAADRARAAVEDMDKAMIGTLHGFASRLLRAYPLQAGLDPEFRIDARGELLDELFEEQWAQWLDAELGEAPPRKRQWLAALAASELETLRELARGLCAPRVDFDRALEPPEALERWLEETAAFLDAEVAAQPAVTGGMPKRLGAAAERLRALAKRRDADLGSADLPSGSWPKSWSVENRKECERAVALAEESSADGERLARQAAELVLPFCRAFRRASNRRGIVSFDDLLIAARDLVRDHLDVREELKAKFSTFLIDEFQDTDPLQGEMLLYLAEKRGRGARRWADAELEPGKLFVVGDPKQSIYRFRGADLAAFEGFVRHMTEREPKALTCALTSNFRSCGEILDAVNAVFPRLMRYAEGSQPPYRAIECGRAAPAESRPRGVEFAVVAAPESGTLRADDVRDAEARWIVEWIETNAKSYQLKDIAILLRTATSLSTYLDALKERGIAYVVEAEKYFFGTQEVLDVLNLLRALDDPEDRVALTGVLRSPLVGLTDADVARIAFARGLDYRRPLAVKVDGADRVRRLFSSLKDLRETVGRVPLAELVRRVEERFQVVELLSAAYHGEQTASNLGKIARMAERASDARGMTLKGFIERVAKDVAEATEEGESPLADEHFDAVRILTIHKAKGLEYPVVIVPNLAGQSVAGREKPVVRLDWSGPAAGIHLPKAGTSMAARYLHARESRREADEAVRLLYVAATRAKERLICVGAENGKTGSFASLLEGGRAWPSLAGAVRTDVAAAPQGETLRRRAAPADDAGIKDVDALARRWRERSRRRDALQEKPRTLAATAAGGESDSARTRPVDQSAGPGGAALGSLCHLVLQRWDFRGKADIVDAVRAAREALSRLDPIRDWDAIEREGAAILRAFLGSNTAAELSRAEILGREMPFLYGEDGTVVRGSIDLLYRLDGSLFVADYKSDRYSDKELPAVIRRHEAQARVYQEAVRRALGIRDVRCRLIFLRTGASEELA